MNTLDDLIQHAKVEIQCFLSNREKIPKYMNVGQLEMTLNELDKMLEYRNPDVFFPYYPKGILDCWQPDDALGIELMNILDLYTKK